MTVRILYLYSTERHKILEGAERGERPDIALYGLNHMADFGFIAEFFDEDRILPPLYRQAQKLAGLVIRQTAHGWNFGQALQSLRRLSDYDCVFATTDSTGLPLAFLKRLGWWQGRLIMASQGLTQSLSMQGWNWGFHLHRWSLSAVDHIVVYGWAERQEIIDHFGVLPEKVDWIPFGVDTKFYDQRLARQTDEKEDVVLSVGLDRSRDFNTLFQAARLLPHITFRVITSRGRFENISLPFNVQVLYDLPIQEVASQYAACRFVVLPVQASPYSFATTTAMEAMAMGKAVVLSRTPAVGPNGDGYELVDGEHCRFVPVGDTKALSIIISELWAEPRLCRELGRRAQAQVRRLFDTHILARRLAEVFNPGLCRRKR